jgi:excisionase family DNA binding protein
MTAVEVAQHLKIHPARVYKLAREGHVPAFKVGADFRFFKEADRPKRSNTRNAAALVRVRFPDAGHDDGESSRGDFSVAGRTLLAHDQRTGKQDRPEARQNRSNQ